MARRSPRPAGRQRSPEHAAGAGRALAERNLAEGRWAAATAWAETALERAVDPDDLAAAAHVFARTGHRQNAERALGLLEALRPHDPERTGFARASCLADLGAVGDALALFRLRCPALSGSVPHVVAFALALERGGNPGEALRFLQGGLEGAGSQAALLQLELGRIMIDHGDAAGGVGHLRAALASGLLDDAARLRALFNLGIGLESGNPAEAIDAYRQAVALDAAHGKARINLAIVLIREGRNDEAATWLRESLVHLPALHEARYLLARCEHVQGRTDEAIRILDGLLAERAGDEAGWELLARCHMETGAADRATETCRRWVHNCPRSPTARHMLASMSGENVPDRADAGHVAGMFDRFADSFNQTLGQLQYRGPDLFRDLLTSHLGEPAGRLKALDAGCGTGLLGPVLRAWATTLVGVDLSPRMLERAAATGLYDRTACCDLIAFLEESPGEFDLIVAADTLNYFGDLGPVLRAAFGALRPDGWLAFSVEQGPLDSMEYHLLPHGRYAHGPPYLMEQLGQRGVEGGTMRRVELRRENDRPVHALLVAVQRPADAGE